MATATITGPEQVDEGPVQDPGAFTVRPPEEVSRRRFTIAVVTGTAVTVPFMLWLLWDLWWGKVNVIRGVSFDYFYDIQARAMFHGHLWVPPGQLSLEAFNHDGHQFTYFGIFPSLIRMPVLLITSRLDGDLTAPSLLLAWFATAVFTALLLWRLRVFIRGTALVGRAEAASYGVLMAGVMGGSVVIYLVATPIVYNEDFAWSIPLVLGSLFVLLGIQDRPSWGRMAALGVLVVCTNLNRTPGGYAVTIGCILVAAWFALGKGGTTARRWAIPLIAVGLVGFLANAAVTYAKFGIPVGLPMADQTWTHLNAYRRHFLAANGGKPWNLNHIPSQFWAYFQPFGARFSAIFPFITPPGSPAAALNGAVMELTYPTASMTTTAPLFIVLGVWGAVTAFRRRGPGRVRMARIVLLTAAVGTVGVFVWGYISQRYIGDLMPLFIVASAIGMIEVWRVLEGRSRKARGWALGGFCALAAYGVAANVAVSAWPVPQWNQVETVGFVKAQQSLSLGSLGATVRTGATLPYWAPSGQLFAVNHCSGLYLSSGNDSSSVPGQQIEHYTWMPVEQSPAFTREIGFTFNRPASLLTHPVTLMTYGKASLVLVPVPPGSVRIVLENSGSSIAWPPRAGWVLPIRYLHAQDQFTVTVDPNLDSLVLHWYGWQYIDPYIAGRGPIVVQTSPPAPPGTTPLLTVADIPMATPPNPMALCHSLVGDR
jgi:hypothetical protein